MTKNEIIKSIDDICEGLRRSTHEANEALSKIRGSIGKMADDENNEKKLDLMLEEKKEEGKRECFELMEKLADMPSEKMRKYFDLGYMEDIIHNFTLEGIEYGLERWETKLNSKPEPEFKRGDIVKVIGINDTRQMFNDCIYLSEDKDTYIVHFEGSTASTRADKSIWRLEKQEE